MEEPIVFLPLSRGKVAIIDFADFEKVGRVKWSALKTDNGSFYAQRKERIPGTKKQKNFYLHCEIMGEKGVDHKDGDGLNCRRENLRLATNQQNQKAFCRKPSGCTSRFRGVRRCKNSLKWRAQIHTNGKDFSLGYFKLEEDAARAYDKKAKELGFFREAFNFKDL